MRHLLILLALIAVPAGAGTRATYAGSDGRTLVIEVADDGDARVGVVGEADYGVLHGGRFHETLDVPAARVALPAAPLSVAALVAEMKAAQKKK